MRYTVKCTEKRPHTGIGDMRLVYNRPLGNSESHYWWCK